MEQTVTHILRSSYQSSLAALRLLDGENRSKFGTQQQREATRAWKIWQEI